MNKLNSLLFLTFAGIHVTAQIRPATNISDARTLQRRQTENDRNFGFENGLTSWTATGNAFRHQPVHDNTVTADRVLTAMLLSSGGIGGDYWKGMPFPIGIKGDAWIGTYENGNGDGPQGTLTSQPFTTDARYIHFLLGGGRDLNKIYVELQVKKQDFEAVWGAGKKGFFGDAEDGYTRVHRITPLVSSEELFRYWFDLDGLMNHQFRNKTYRLVITDASSDGWGHINVDDIQLGEDVSVFIPVVRNGVSLMADPDKPVWGFADTHSHPAGNLGFGGSLIWGTVGGPAQQALALCQHGALESVAEENGSGGGVFGHNNKGWPVFSFWPSFTDRTHQTCYIDWIKRAYDGGLRILAALAVNNTTMAFSLNKGSYPDGRAAALQLDYLRTVFSGQSWAAIVTTPAEARKAILENRLAVVLGVEVDNLEDYTTAAYLYRRDHDGSLAATYQLPLKPVDAASETGRPSTDYARQVMRTVLDDLKNKKVVQITPIHLADNMIGGAAVYDRMFNEVSYESTGDGYHVTDGSGQGFKYLLHKDNDLIMDLARNVTTGGNHLYQEAATMEANPLGHMNTKGLTDYGRAFVKEMARHGMIWDVDHSSYYATRDLIAEAARYHYPLLSSHSDFAELYFTSSAGFKSDPEADYASFGTSSIHHLPHESMKTADAVRQINQLGGMFNPILTLTNLKYQSSVVANDCPGSSRTWVQKYLYVTAKAPGKGVGLATDRGMLESVGPRFGNKAAGGLEDNEYGNGDRTKKVREELLTDVAAGIWKQSNGVRYSSPMAAVYSDMFRNRKALYDWDGDMVNGMMTCLLYKAGARSFTDITSIGKSDLAERTDGYLVKKAIERADFRNSGLDPGPFLDRYNSGAMRNMLKGMFATRESDLTSVAGELGTPWEEAAAGYCVVHDVRPERLSNYNRFNKDALTRIYGALRIAWDMTSKMEGGNEPLRRCTTGYRDWDFNLDGIAHEGMLPDLIQDLKNIGVTGVYLQPLFMSAEEYIRVWERSVAAGGNVRD